MNSNVSQHLSLDYVARYLQRTLSAQERADAADHLAMCEACRNLIAESPAVEQVFTSLRREMQSEGRQPEQSHLEYEQLEAYVDNQIEDADREIVDSHVERCRICGDELRDLQAFRAVYAAGKSQATDGGRESRESIWWKLQHFWHFPGYVAGAMAVVVLVVVGVITLRPLFMPELAIEMRAKPSQAGEVPALPSEDARLVVPSGVHSLTLEVPSDVRNLIGHQETLMGSPIEEASFELIAPVGTFVGSSRPTFRWKPLTGATEYRVQVLDSSLNPVLASPPTTSNFWKPARALRPGKVYLWQVTAMKDAHSIIAPAPPVPPAKFKVIDQALATELDQLKQAQPQAHFTLGTAYAAAGLLEDAEREFRLVSSSDSDYPLAQRFLAELKALRAPVQ